MMFNISAVRFVPLLSLIAGLLAGAGNSSFGQVPDPPLELTAQASFPGDLSISLFWIDNSLNEIGFEVQRRRDGDVEFTTIGVTAFNNVNSYNDIGLEENTTYFYRVLAFNTDGPSEFSNTASAPTSYARPLQVSNLAGEVIDGSVSLTWTDEANNETLFDVERAEIGVSTEYTVIATLPPDSTSYIDSTQLDGAFYSYRVRPWRFDVFGGAPLTVELTTGSPVASPGSIAARARSRSSIEISWSGRFADTALVHVQRFDLNTGLWADAGFVRAKSRKFVDTGLQANTFYGYRIRVETPTAVSLWESTSATTKRR